MPNDPRWQEAHALLDAAFAAHAADNKGKFLRLFDLHCQTLESIADDPTAGADDRERAAALLEEIEAQYRAAAPEVLRTLADIARDPAAAPADRVDAVEMLVRATKAMPTANDERH